MFASDNDSDILRGEAARLSGIRAALSASDAATSSSLLQAALEPFLRLDSDNEEDIQEENEEGDLNIFNHEDNANDNNPLFQDYVNLSWRIMEAGDVGESRGYLVVTRAALLFCCHSPLGHGKDSSENRTNTTNTSDVSKDWYVAPTSITLHALTGAEDDDASSPNSSNNNSNAVYVQLENPNDESDPIEWTVKPCSDNAPDLYAALSKLVSLHPVDPHEDTNIWDNGEGGGDNDEYANFDPEDMIWASDIRGEDNDDGATEEERQAMLERLDQVLIVPPEYEIAEPGNNEGQFDDADEEDDEHDGGEDDQML